MWEEWEQRYSDICLFILMASALTRLNYNISIHQTACKNKAKFYQCISNHKAKFIAFFIWPRGTLGNIFKAKSLPHLRVWEQCEEVSHSQIIC